MKLSILIPVYNEAGTVQAVLERVRGVALDAQKEIVVVDDGSTDGTRDILSRLPKDAFRVIYSPQNEGKGAAIRRALKAATGDVVVVQDADTEYDPGNFAQLIEPFANPSVQVVYGSRFMHTGFFGFLKEWARLRFNPKSPEKRYVANFLGVRLLNIMCRVLYGQRLTDEATCYKLLRRDLINDLDLQCTGFEFCPEVTAKVGRRKIPIVEVPIDYHPRTFQEGKKLRVWHDGWRAVWTLLKYRRM